MHKTNLPRFPGAIFLHPPSASQPDEGCLNWHQATSSLFAGSTDKQLHTLREPEKHHVRRGHREYSIRDHWSIENRCHWVLDLVLSEDRCQERDPNAGRNSSLVREAALKALRATTCNDTLESKRKRVSLDPAFRLTLLPGLRAQALALLRNRVSFIAG